MFDWEAFLHAAERLLQASPTDEAIQRIAIGRAYFALFNLAKAQLASEGVQVPATAWAHEAVWQAYQAAPRGSRRSVAQTGFRLRRLRDRADYEAYYPTVELDAVWALKRFRRAIDLLRSMAHLDLLVTSGHGRHFDLDHHLRQGEARDPKQGASDLRAAETLARDGVLPVGAAGGRGARGG